MSSLFERVAPDSPDRCQGAYTQGQCPYKSVPGSDKCHMHGGHWAVRKAEANSKRAYRLAQWQQRTEDFADDAEVKSLRGEIGILRLLMEETVRMCKDGQELLLYSSKISDLATRLEKLVSSCHRLETSTGLLLDKAAALQLASVIVSIISEHVRDEEAIDAIAQKILIAITHTKTEVKVDGPRDR
jgi:hypothetical protein